jgi:hypothetical protein
MSDLIDRRSAIDALNEYFDRIGKLKRRGLNKGEKAIRLDTVGTINSLPPAQPETATVTIGRTRGDVTMWYKCDACDEPVDQNDNYCRNCGRKLKHE